MYFIATKLLREQGLGPAILVSPLLALMRNQIAAAERMGVRALTIHSGNTGEWDEVKERVRCDEVDILLISPERLSNQYFRNEVLGPVAGRISLLVVDEAHCISDWGHDFRPHYRFIERIVRQLPSNLRLLATTATANQRVMDRLGADPRTESSGFTWRTGKAIALLADNSIGWPSGALGVAGSIPAGDSGQRDHIRPYAAGYRARGRVVAYARSRC